MSKTIADFVVEKQKQYYPNGLPTLDDFRVGDNVKVITPCQDFCFFYEETGVIRSIKGKYLAIDVEFDKPRHFKDGDIQRNFNFNPEDLFKIGKPKGTKMKVDNLTNEELIEEIEKDHDLGDQFSLKRELVKRFKAVISSAVEQNEITNHEPYFGWCDVEGCEHEACNSGGCWRETGFWKVCGDHSRMWREGEKQPHMKQEAIDRENSRDKVTGFLPNVKGC